MKTALLIVAARLVLVLIVLGATFGFIGSLVAQPADNCGADAAKSAPTVRLLTALNKVREVQP